MKSNSYKHIYREISNRIENGTDYNWFGSIKKKNNLINQTYLS